MRMQPGRVALVTGASRGLGAAIARSLGRDGLRVAVNYHRGKDRAEALANALQQEGAVAEAFGADVTTAEGIDELVGAVTERLGEIEVLVLNATGPQPERGSRRPRGSSTALTSTSSSRARSCSGRQCLPG